jgi:phospholipid/cholesterol/gamma-HCH transport system substrate-binding protein
LPVKRHQLELVVGAFLLLGIACLSWLAIRMGEVGVTQDAYPLRARFASISGLREGAYVELAGVRVGKVVDIDVDPQEYAAEIVMAIDGRIRLQEDTIASIRTSGIIGDKFVKITPGGSEVLLAPGELIFETEPSISLEELISKYIFESGD